MLVPLALASVVPLSAPPVDFEREIAPLLAARCLPCHGAEKERSGYRLDVKSVALTGGETSAPNILPGDAEHSPLIRFVSGLEPDKLMPPKGEPLSEAEIALVRRWIDEGAVWPEHASATVRTEAREDGQGEGRRFAGTGLGRGDEIAAAEDDGDGAKLNRSRVRVASGLDAAEDLLREIE
jgi:hypothetical protein